MCCFDEIKKSLYCTVSENEFKVNAGTVHVTFIMSSKRNFPNFSRPPACHNWQHPRMRSIQQILPRTSPHWVGDGFHVFPIFSHLAFTKKVSPFLMFDYAAPEYFAPTRKKRGVGQHPTEASKR